MPEPTVAELLENLERLRKDIQSREDYHGMTNGPDLEAVGLVKAYRLCGVELDKILDRERTTTMKETTELTDEEINSWSPETRRACVRVANYINNEHTRAIEVYELVARLTPKPPTPLTREEANSHGKCYTVSNGEMKDINFRSVTPGGIGWDDILFNGAKWFRTEEGAQAYAAWLKEEAK